MAGTIIITKAPCLCAGCGKTIGQGEQAREYPGGKTYHMTHAKEGAAATKIIVASTAPASSSFLEMALMEYIERCQMALGDLLDRLRSKR